MARPVWTGSLSFGLVNLRVALFRAVQEHDLSFHQLERDTGRRIRYQKVADGSDQPVSAERIVKGYEVESGRYVILESDELAALAPQRSKTITITDFVQLKDIDPVYYERAYYLGPDEGSETAYALLLEAMSRTGRVAVASFVMRSSEYLAVVRPADGVLVLSTLFYADEVKSPKATVPNLPGRGELRERELGIATTLVEQMTVDWQPQRYHDDYRDRVTALIDAKAAGQAITVEPEAAPAPVLDLMEALRRSVEQARGQTGGPGEDPSAPPPPERTKVPTSTQPTAAEVGAEATREQLYEQARRLKIPGRSRMSREELQAAVSESGSASERTAQEAV